MKLSIRGDYRVVAVAGLVAIAAANLFQLKETIGPVQMNPVDETFRYEQQILLLRTFLPKTDRVGYLSDVAPVDPVLNAQTVKKYYLTQYALAPIVVRSGTKDEFIIGCFSDPKLAAIQTTGLTVVKDFGDGLVLLRKKTN